MRIITLCFSSTVGGLELATLRQGAALRSRGHHVTAVLPDAPDLIAHAHRMELPVEIITPSLPYLDVAAALKLRRLIRRERAELILVARTRDLSTAMLGAGKDVALVLYQQMQSGIRKRDFFHDRVFGRLDGCIAITQHTARQLIECTALEPSKVSVIPYGIDTTLYAPGALDRDEARAAYDLPEEAFVVGIIGGFNPAKGQREFITALGMAAEMEPELAGSLHGLLIGERTNDSREYIEELHRLRGGLPFADRIRFHPFQSDPRTGFAALDLFVLASYSETFGMVVQESLAMGVATIATDSEGVREIITDGETGLLVPPHDPEAIARAVVRLYRDETLRRRLASNGAAFARAAYDNEAQYRKFEEALQEAMGRRG